MKAVFAAILSIVIEHSISIGFGIILHNTSRLPLNPTVKLPTYGEKPREPP
jgi:hypothetical protein